MADEIAVTTPPIAAPAADTAVSAPVAPAPATETAAPAPESKPSESAPSTEAKPAETTPEAKPDAEATLLDKPKADATETKPEGETKLEGEKPAETKTEPAPEPSYEAFALPEGVTFDNEKMGAFTKELASFETLTKAPHEEVQKFGQSLINRHVEEVKAAQDRLLTKLIEDGKAERAKWADDFVKSPEFANRTDTVLKAAHSAIETYGGNAQQQAELYDALKSTGMANHPAMIRLLANMKLARPDPVPLAPPKIAKAAPRSQMEKRYGNNG